MANSIFKVFACSALICSFLTGCAPTYPKEKIYESIIELCKKEYKLDVDAKVAGNTVAVYLPVEHLFDAVLSIESKALKKINDVILGISRVTLSTDAKFDFYVVIAQDPQLPEIEIVYIRYVEDVKRFWVGEMSRDESGRRAVIALKTPPQAERERILRELFEKLKIEDKEGLIKEYLKAEESVSGISEISYWNKTFYLKEINLPEFLTAQMEERIKIEFRQDKDLNKWYEFRSVQGKFSVSEEGVNFMFDVNAADRVQPLYLDSGLELGALEKNTAVFKKMLGLMSNIFKIYKLSDFNEVEISLPSGKLKVTARQLEAFRAKKLKVEDLI